MRENKPELVLFLGGMVDLRCETPPDRLWREFDEITAALGAPVYDAAGDCRLSPLSAQHENAGAAEKYFPARQKNRYYSFEHKNNLFIALDSENLAGKSTEAEAQLDFLRKALADSFRYSNVFIFTHRSLWLDGESGEWIKTVHPLIDGRVKYVFGAGAHFFDFRKVGDVTYVTSGSPPCISGHPTRPSFAHFLLADVTQARAAVRLMPLAPVPLENLEASEGGKTELFTTLAARHVRIQTLSSRERLSLLKPDLIIRELDIRRGMDIVDVGAGTGLFTFPLADALKGTGNVYATDTASSTVEYLREKARDDYKNVFPVLVKSSGLDSFYKKHSFDLIFLSDVYGNLRDPAGYFREMRPSLKKNTGRLYIINSKNDPDFSEVEFGDFRKVISTLTMNGEEFPVYRRLSRKIRDFTRAWDRKGEVPDEIRKEIVHSFNEMLSDRTLVSDLSDYYELPKTGSTPLLEKFVNPLDVRLAAWLIESLDEAGMLGIDRPPAGASLRKQLRRLNRILFTGIFQSDVLDWITTRRFRPEKESVTATMESAGYRLIKEHDMLTHHYFLEFARRD